MLLYEVVFKQERLIFVVCRDIFYASGTADQQSCLDVLVSAKIGCQAVFKVFCLAYINNGSLSIAPEIDSALVWGLESRLVQYFPVILRCGLFRVGRI